MKYRSNKMEATYRIRRKLVAELLEAHPICQAKIPRVCTGRSEDCHEVISRGRGGSILDRDNILCVCRRCHTWITEHPEEAEKRGLLKHSWER